MQDPPMINNRNFVLDTMSEVYQLLRPWRTHEFWDFATHDIVPNSIYVLGRKQFTENVDRIRELCKRPDICIVFDNVAEGSWTLVSQLHALGVTDLIQDQKVLLISGGRMPSEYHSITYDHFITCILDYDENQAAMRRVTEIFDKTHKPHTFLFLNGRARPHRKYLWEKFNQLNLLDQALWTMLDGRPTLSRNFNLYHDDVDLMARTTPIQHLPSQYEFSQFRSPKIDPVPNSRGFIKTELFSNLWGEIYLQPEPYIDTYFSVVTETVFEYSHSFRTEKIAKPLMQGHPWICVANPGFYHDMKNLGFQTFGNIIDESFDKIENHQDRLDRIVQLVQDLVNSDLVSFLKACEPVCKYNQQHLVEVAPQIRKNFPNTFFNFIK